MTENTMNNPTDTMADLPPSPNGHGASNGAPNGEPLPANTMNEGAPKDATPLSKKQKKAQQRAAAKAAAATSASNATTPVAFTPPSELPAVPLIETSANEVPVGTPVEILRVRMKIWAHPQTAKRYLMTNAHWRDVDRNGQPITDVMIAYAMREDDTMVVTLTATQWNTLPFFYFQEDGPAPRTTTLPNDVIA